MCGRFTIAEDVELLQERFEFENTQIDFKPRYNLAPGQEAPVVVMEDTRCLEMMRWGLVPFWAKEISTGYKMINARAETLAQKPSFSRSFKEKRCLVLADGFFEWKKVEGSNSKIPMRLVLKDREPFAFAGLWDEWQPPDGDELRSFTIITTEANDIIRPIHERMPVILRKEDEVKWLDPDIKDPEKLSKLLISYPSGMMYAHEVSSRINSPKNDSPECIREISRLE